MSDTIEAFQQSINWHYAQTLRGLANGPLWDQPKARVAMLRIANELDPCVHPLALHYQPTALGIRCQSCAREVPPRDLRVHANG